jgi:hypothetical protein
VKDPRRINFGGHTDVGIITLLFNFVRELQVLPAGSTNVDENWRYIRPQPDCALINIADTLTRWTVEYFEAQFIALCLLQELRLNVRVKFQAYLVRAEKGTTMQRRRGGSVIPPLGDGQEDDRRDVDSWAVWRAEQIIDGSLKPESRGGR